MTIDFAGAADESRYIRRAMRTKFPGREVGELNTHELSAMVMEAQNIKTEEKKHGLQKSHDRLSYHNKRNQG